MATNSETGHAKNVANFEQLLIKCTSFDGSFNPSNPAIQLSAMQNTLNQGKDCMASVNEAEGILSKAVATRSLAFKPFSKLTTRISNAVKVSGVSQLIIRLFYSAPIRLNSLDLICKYNYSGKFCEGCCVCAGIGLGSL